MTVVSFVQSEFQARLVRNTLPNSSIVVMPRNNWKYVIDIFLLTYQLLFSLLINKKVIIFDHRNPLIIISAVFSIFSNASLRNIYVGDDGMHSVLVDKFHDKFLYWRVKPLKKVLLRLVENRILNFNRIQSLVEIKRTGDCDTEYRSYFDTVSCKTRSFKSKNIYIDQPGILEAMSNSNLQSFLNDLKKHSDILVLLHPRRKSSGIFSDAGIPVTQLADTETEIRSCCPDISVHGFFSTTLLGAKHWGARIFLYELPREMEDAFKTYGQACQATIASYPDRVKEI